MKDLVIKKKERTYIKGVFEITWENLSPIFDELAKRSIGSAAELEQWLRDRSEIDALLEEDFAWRYIRILGFERTISFMASNNFHPE